MKLPIRHLLLAAVLLTLSCKRNSKLQPSWNTQVSAPLFKSSLTLNNIVGDTLVKTNADSSLQLVFHNTIYTFNPDSQAIKIPDTSVVTSYSLNVLQLANDSLNYPFSLGALCLQLEQPGQSITNQLIGGSIIQSNHQDAVIPAVPALQSGNIPIDATSFFQSAKIKTGTLQMSIINGFPVEISVLTLTLRNASDMALVDSVTFYNILPGHSAEHSDSLKGKSVDGNLIAKITDLECPGSNGASVPIDTSNAIVAKIRIVNVTADSATANFPSQSIIDQAQETTYNLGGGAKLKKMSVKSGSLKIKINNSLSQQTYFTYKLPSATNAAGQTIIFTKTLPPANGGAPASYESTIDLAGYTIDLTGIDGKKFNTFVNDLKVSIDSTGKPVTLSSKDSILIDYGFQSIVPDYVAGYLGQQIVQVGPQTSGLSIFNKIKSGTFKIEDVTVNLGIQNGLGAEGRLTIYKLQSIRSNTNNTVDLSAPTVMNTPLFIPRAKGTLNPAYISYPINTANSNIKPWIENLPDKVAYRLDVFMNPNGNDDNYGDFAYSGTRINVNMDMTMPLSFIAQQLALQDTIAFSLGDTKVIDHIKQGTFHLICDNGLPLAATLHIALYDNEWNFVTDLVSDNSKIAGAPLGNNCKVLTSKQTVIDIPADATKMQKIKQAQKAIIYAVFDSNNTSTCNSYLKIYSTYKLDCKLTGNFTYFTGE